MPISLVNCEKSANLTEITWAHAVNSWKELNQTLASKSKFWDDNLFFSFQMDNYVVQIEKE